MATDPVEPDRVYAAVGAYTNEWDPNNGAILYSDDRGETWGIAELPFKQGGNMPGRGMGERLVVNPADNAELYLGTPSGNGLWRSKDYGRTWAEVENFPNPGNFVIEPGNVILGDNQGVIWIDFDQIGGKIYVGVADPADPLYVSEDGGATWQAVPGAAEALGEVDGNRTFPNQSAVDDTNGYLYIATCNDPGPGNAPAASGNGGKIMRLATQTGEWTDVSPAYNPRGVIPGFGGITVDRQNPGTIMTVTRNNWWPDEVFFRSTDSGADLVAQLGLRRRRRPHRPVRHGQLGQPLAVVERRGPGPGVRGQARVDDRRPRDRPARLRPHHVGYRRDHLGHRGADAVGLAGRADRRERIRRARRPAGREVHCWRPRRRRGGVRDHRPRGARRRALLRRRRCLTGFVHTDLDRAEPSIPTGWSMATSVDFAQSDPDVLVAVGQGYYGNEMGHVAISTDRGETWRKTGIEGLAGDRHPGTVAVSADGSTILWSPSDTEVTPVYSTDLGETWTPVEGLPAGAMIRSDRVNASILYAFSGGTFYRSTDGGATFTDTGATGLPSAGVDDFRAAPGKKSHVWLCRARRQGRGRHRPVCGAPRTAAPPGSSITTVRDGRLGVGFGKAAKNSRIPHDLHVGADRRQVRHLPFDRRRRPLDPRQRRRPPVGQCRGSDHRRPAHLRPRLSLHPAAASSTATSPTDGRRPPRATRGGPADVTPQGITIITGTRRESLRDR